MTKSATVEVAARDTGTPIPTAREAQLLGVACSLFAKRGFEATSLRDIAEAAKIGKATLYHYFPSKEDLYERVVIQSLRPLVIAVTDAVAKAKTPKDRVRAFVLTAARDIETKRDQWQASGHAFRDAGQSRYRGEALQLRDDYEKLLRQCIEEGITSGEFCVMDSALATRFLLSTLNYITRWHSPKGKLTVRNVVEQYLDMALKGFETRKATPAARHDSADRSSAMGTRKPEAGRASSSKRKSGK